MKKIKKITAAIVAALCIVTTCTAPAFAAEALGLVTSTQEIPGEDLSEVNTPLSSLNPYYVKDVTTIAPNMKKVVWNAFKELGFKVYVNQNAKYAGYFDARTRKITLNQMYSKPGDVGYHEMGHFLAFVAGNYDTSSTFVAIYNSEKSKFPGPFKAYAQSSSNEYFASCVAEYYRSMAARENLKTYCPKTYQAILNAFKKVTPEQIAKVKSIYSLIWK